MNEEQLRRWQARIAAQPQVNDCCKQAENLVVVESIGNRAKATCKVCKRNHYYMLAEPGRFGLKSTQG